MRIKIVQGANDPYPQVVDAETGEAIEGIARIKYEYNARYGTEVTLELQKVDAEMEFAPDRMDTTTEYVQRPRVRRQ